MGGREWQDWGRRREGDVEGRRMEVGGRKEEEVGVLEGRRDQDKEGERETLWSLRTLLCEDQDELHCPESYVLNCSVLNFVSSRCVLNLRVLNSSVMMS